MADCEVLIDANIVMHFTPIDQIDWCKLTLSDTCTVVITPILMRELEHKKITSPSSTLRGRIGRLIDFLVEKAAEPDPIALRPKVTLAFAETEPTLAFASYGLVREVNDDHYIAAAIERKAVSGQNTFIASNDGGMALKLRSREIGILRLPEELRLPAEPDPEQKELREVKLELARIKSQRPKLAACFEEGKTKLELKVPRAVESGVPRLDEAIAEYPPLPLSYVGTEAADLASMRMMGQLRATSRERLQAYNDSLQTFYSKYEGYLREVDGWTERMRLTSTVSIELHNNGNATATDVDVTLRFPPSVTVMEPDDLPRQPESPEAPRKPTALALFQDMYLTPRETNFARPPLPYIPRPNAPTVHEDDPHAVRFSTKTLKQKCVVQFDEFLIERKSDDANKGIEIEVEITYHEGEPVVQKLAIFFSQGETLKLGRQE